MTAEDPRTVLFFGFDNSFLRTFVFPAVLGAVSGAPELPAALVCNEFYLLSGEKFSTGRQHVIHGLEVFDKQTCDQLRLYLAATNPDVRRTDFTVAGYTGFLHTELRGRWQSWLDGVQQRLAGSFGGAAPEAGSWNVEAERFYGQIRELTITAAGAYLPDRCSLWTAAAALRGFVAQAVRFAAVTEQVLAVAPSSGVARTCVALELMAVRTFAMVVAPVAPNLAARLAAAVGEPGGVPVSEEPRWVPTGVSVRFGEPFFTDHAIEGSR